MQDYYNSTYTWDYDDKRMRYDVTKWDAPINGVRIGKVVFYSDVEEEVIEMAKTLNYNQELQDIAEEAIQAAVDLEYETMMESLMSEMMMMEYAARSYDNDAEAYAEMY